MKKFTFISVLFICLATQFSFAQFRITGIVKDEKSIPVSGVVITLETTQLQVISDIDGMFIINKLRPGNYTLSLRAMGYESKIEQVEISGDKEITVMLTGKPLLTDEVTVSTTRTGNNAGMAVSLYSKEEIEKLNTGQDLPYLLQMLPAVVATSDAGNGIGYTGIRIRGSDASRVNVTINGIPVNDAESQLVYWVNMPDFSSSAENIEVTRGAGVSTNGAGAFGGTINIQTAHVSDSAYLQTSHAGGTFNTFKNNLSFGTGLLRNNLSLEGRLSSIKSDGFIDRGSSDLQSLYLSTAWKNANTIVRFNLFTGKEVTYQSWYGVPESRIKGDESAMQEYIIRNGLNEEESENLLNSGRTYNYYTYDDQTDNYRQDHYQLLFSHSFKSNWLLNIALHATKGSGYYEEFKSNQSLADYAIADVVLNDTIITSTDLIRRRWLDNIFYGTTWTLKGNIIDNFTLTFGGGVNRYDGDHFGEVIWAEYAGNSDIRQRYYENNAVKDDLNAYLRGEWEISRQLHLFGDMQLRRVDYRFTGPNEDGLPAPQEAGLQFFNPKMGVTYRPQMNMTIYGSVSIANKEPNRNDYTESSALSRPKHESMIDYEAGLKYASKRFNSGINFYYMDYYDQLVLTGKVNDVGSYTRTNINRSYRAGMELELAVQLLKKMILQGNVTLSDNRIKNYVEYTDSYDVDFNYTGQQAEVFKNTSIAFSPEIISNIQLQYQPFRNTEASFILRHISKQYLDNTENEASILPAYTVGDIRFSYSPTFQFCKKIRFDLLLNNVFSTLYESNGYTFGYLYDNTRIRENFYYPQADFNFMGQVTLRF
ncbi:MAG: TonB-dependent receptor [Bacteroidetes bacterium]|nr:TonB-dependent receptor [Bacteroidota bacterium]